MSIEDEQRAQQRDQWNASAPAWEKHEAWIEENTGELSKWLCDAARLAPGMRVLDLACGTGAVAEVEARRVAPNGTVTATDLAPEMVAAARRRIERLGLAVEIREMDAEHLDFPDGSFDAVICRFGLMFCPDPTRAVREMHRVLRTGGRFALCVWDEPAKNPFFTGIGQLMAKLLALPPVDPKAPGVFRLAPAGELAGVLRAGGFDRVEIAPFPLTFRYRSPEHYWELQSQLATSLKAAVAKLAPEQRAPLHDAVLELAAANIVDGVVAFRATPLTAAGVK